MLDTLMNTFAEVNSPAYVFDEQGFIDRMQLVKESFGETIDICYSIKANPFLLAVLPDGFSNIAKHSGSILRGSSFRASISRQRKSGELLITESPS